VKKALSKRLQQFKVKTNIQDETPLNSAKSVSAETFLVIKYKMQ
tara:strand:+ start:692 stop:823 length:132 start_codon:yes stop_codon:yes gene_type:complete